MAVIKRWRLKKKYALLTIILSAVVLFTLVLGMSYAFFTTRVTSKELVIYTGSLRVEFNNNGNGINLNGTKPMTNTEGLSTDGYTFNIKNTGTIKARYQVRIELENDNEIPLEYIKMSYMQTKQENNVTDEPTSDPILLSNLNKSLVFIQNEKIDALKEDSFNLKLWLDISTPNDMQGKTFKAKIIVDAIQDVDEGYVFTSSPIIKLNKDENENIDQNLKVGDTYTDLGVMSVEDDKDNLDIENVVTEIEYFDGSDITTVNSIDTSVVGIYYINYSITDSDNKTGRAIRVITVNNTNTIPTITLNGSSTMTTYQGVTFNDPGATSEGNKVITVGYVDINTLGTYIIKYIVVDNNGNTNSITRIVNVEDSGLTGLALNVLANNALITVSPTLTTSSNNTTDPSGLYALDVTNGFGGTDGTTYYFRGNVTNNYVDFAGLTWRIVRINEDGTTRLILDDRISTTAYPFNYSYNNYSYMYYSNSGNYIKKTLEDWYTANIINTNVSKTAAGNYFCEAAKTYGQSNAGVLDMVIYDQYTPNLKCEYDSEGKGLLSVNIGLITYDELLLAGGYRSQPNEDYYLYKNFNWWTMSPAGYLSNLPLIWTVVNNGRLFCDAVYEDFVEFVRPVINLKADVTATGTGTASDPYVIE